MNELFTALLDISKLDAGTLTPTFSDFPIAHLLRRIEGICSGPAREKGLSLRVLSGRAWVHSDPILLERILLNLVLNAIRYTARGRILVGSRPKGDSLRLEVWDTGEGIPESQIQAIFGEFIQLNRGGKTHGLGLGLAIVDRLCQLLGYRIRVTSKVGRGSCFAVDVPAAAARLEASATESDARSVGAALNKVVVVVDDDPLVVDGMRGLLRSWGCEVVTAKTGDAALAELRTRKWAADLVISDYHLSSNLTGIEVIEQLRAEFGPDLPAFLISGDISPERLTDALARGCKLLHKPVRPMALRAIVDRHLKASEPADIGRR